MDLVREVIMGLHLSSETFDGSCCWAWSTGSIKIGSHRKEDGRPRLGDDYVYRIVYELLRHDRPSHVCHHRCERPWCVNPWHIDVMPQGEHLKEHGLTGDWGQRHKTHCPAGHPYNEENTYVWRNERQCKICMRAAKRRYRARLRGES